MKIKNNSELDKWLFEHACVLRHMCNGVKGEIEGEIKNIAFVDTVTGERIDLIYD